MASVSHTGRAGVKNNEPRRPNAWRKSSNKADNVSNRNYRCLDMVLGMSLLKCPKCKNTKIRIIEHLVCPEEMYQNVKGEVTYFTGTEGGNCYVIKWEGVCLECGKKWRIRKRFNYPSVMIPHLASKEDTQKWLNGEIEW